MSEDWKRVKSPKHVSFHHERLSFTAVADIMAVFDTKVIREENVMEKSKLTACIVVDNRVEDRNKREKVYQDTPLPFAESIPEPILEMIRLYEFGDGSPAHRARMFCVQGRFMEQYEDDFPWQGDFHRYFTTYHDLNVRQLRGYFSWRTGIRNGVYRPIATSLAYMYLYELLCGIGASSDEDVLQKMKTFEENYVDSGIGDPGMRKNIRRWMFEYGILHGLPREKVLSYANPDAVEFDRSLMALRNPVSYTDEEIFCAISRFTGGTLEKSALLTRDRARSVHLFAEMWKHLSEDFEDNGRDLFSFCFGERKCYPWHPLSNAVYWEEKKLPDTDFVLDACRTYHLRDGKWQEERYGGLSFHSDWLRSLVRASDRLFRRALKTGHYLQERKDEEWAVPYIEAAMQKMEAEERRAAMPVIDIDYSGLDQIREDAAITRERLLTDEEIRDGRMAEPFGAQGSDKRAPEKSVALEAENRLSKSLDERDGENRLSTTFDGKEPGGLMDYPVNEGESAADKECHLNGGGSAADKEYHLNGGETGADSLYRRILLLLLDGKAVNDVMKENHLMSSVVTDTINEAFFDEIGDNVLVCDGEEIRVVEDYREDIVQALGEIKL